MPLFLRYISYVSAWTFDLLFLFSSFKIKLTLFVLGSRIVLIGHCHRYVMLAAVFISEPLDICV